MEEYYLRSCGHGEIRRVISRADRYKLFYVPYHIYSGDATLVISPLVFGKLPSVDNILGIRNSYLREARGPRNPSFQQIESNPLDPHEIVHLLKKVIEDIDLMNKESFREVCSYAKEIHKWNLSRVLLIPITRYPSRDRSKVAARTSSIVAKAIVKELKLENVTSLEFVGTLYCPEALVVGGEKIQVYELLTRGVREDHIHTELYRLGRSSLREALDNIPYTHSLFI